MKMHKDFKCDQIHLFLVLCVHFAASSAHSTTAFGWVCASRSSGARAQAQELELDHLYH